MSTDGTAPDSITVRDVPFIPPDCGITTASGSIRYSIDGVVGRGAADASGNIYVPVAIGDGQRGVRSVDPCGRLRWQTTVWSTEGHRFGDVRLDPSGNLLLTDVRQPGGMEPIARLDVDGTMLGVVAADSLVARTLGVPSGLGPVVASVDRSNLVNQIERFDVNGVHLETISDWSNANECTLSPDLIACLDRAYDVTARRVLWMHSFEILDGTLRHVVGEALYGGTLYSFFFGISSFVLEAKDARTGRSLFRTTVARSSTGQSNMLAAGPVVRDDGEIFVYLRVGGAGGAAYEFTPGGMQVETFRAESATELFDDGGNLALGRDGTLYLAVGRAVYALDRAMHVRWMLPTMERVDRAWSMITPAGDLLVHTERDSMLAIATDSPGVSGTAWPLARGDERNANGR